MFIMGLYEWRECHQQFGSEFCEIYLVQVHNGKAYYTAIREPKLIFHHQDGNSSRLEVQLKAKIVQKSEPIRLEVTFLVRIDYLKNFTVFHSKISTAKL